MRTKFFMTAPDDQEFTIQITMTLGKWKQLLETIGEKWPGWEFRRAINEVVYAANKSFNHIEETDDQS